MAATWPVSQLDDPNSLLALLGSFWSETYHGRDLLRSLLYAAARVEDSNRRAVDDLAACLAREKVPLNSRREWYAVRLLESGRNAGLSAAAVYGGGESYGGGYAYGSPRAGLGNVWDVPAEVLSAAAVLDSFRSPALFLSEGVEFSVGGGVLALSVDPFATPGVAVSEVFDGGEVVDRSCTLWLYGAVVAARNVYEQVGYVLAADEPDGPDYRDAVNAAFDALVTGTTERDVRRFLSAAFGVPLARRAGVVERVFYQPGLTVCTGEDVYSFPADHAPVVSAGSAVRQGDPLSDGLLAGPCRALPFRPRAVSVPKALLGVATRGELTFGGDDTPLVVDQTHQSGFTRVSFALGGYADDAEAFWDAVHDNGVAAGRTLAMLLDSRPEESRDETPGPAHLPASVNPLDFLLANVFRANVFAARLRNAPSGGRNHAAYSALLRKIVPPATLLLVFQEESFAEELDADSVEEAVYGFDAVTQEEDVDPDAMVSERVRCFEISTPCN